jgi:fluoride exporter
MRPSLLLLVFVGGGIGSVCRYAMATALQRNLPGPFPAGTFFVNLLGCFLIGLVGALGFERAAISPDARIFIMVGIIGGFTTFSAFAWETLSLLSLRDILRASCYVGGSVFLGLLGTWLGRALGRIGA